MTPPLTLAPNRLWLLTLAVFALVASLLIGLQARAAAQTSEPCQVWVDALAVHQARQAANSDYPQDRIDRATANLAACKSRHSTFYTNFDTDNRRSATPTQRQVQSYTYTPIENPYRGWHICELSGLSGSSCSSAEDLQRDNHGSTPLRTQGDNAVLNEHEGRPDKTRETHIAEQSAAEQQAEDIDGSPTDWYRPPVGGGTNGTIRQPCTAGGNKLVRDGDNNWVDSGSRPPAGESCYD